MKRKAKKLTYRVGQTVTLPAIKGAGIPKQRAKVLEVDKKRGVLAVEIVKEDRVEDDVDGLAEVALSEKTGRIIADQTLEDIGL